MGRECIYWYIPYLAKFVVSCLISKISNNIVISTLKHEFFSINLLTEHAHPCQGIPYEQNMHIPYFANFDVFSLISIISNYAICNIPCYQSMKNAIERSGIKSVGSIWSMLIGLW